LLVNFNIFKMTKQIKVGFMFTEAAERKFQSNAVNGYKLLDKL